MASGFVLIAEDDESIRQLLSERLRAEGYDVAEVDNGKAAIELLGAADVDVVLLDLHMPLLGGGSVLSVARDTAPETEVVVLTADTSLQSLVDCLRRGAFDVITKPFRAADLVSTLARAVERRRLRVAAALYKASQVIFSARDRERLPERIVEVALRAMIADDVSVMLPDEDGRLTLAHSCGLPEADVAAARSVSREGIAEIVARSGRPQVLQGDLRGDSRYEGRGGRRPIRSSIVFPLLSGERLVGLLNINRIQNPRPYRVSDLERASVLASQVVLALENARLIERLVSSERLAAIGQVTAGIAHEINNPAAFVLASIDYAQSALRSPDAGSTAGSPDVLEALRDAKAGTERIAEIVRDMRGIARGDDGTLEDFDVAEAVHSAIRIASAEIRKEGTLTVELDTTATVRGTRGGLSQVFVNLLTNAAFAISDVPRERRTILVRSRRDADRILIDVRDRGTGIAASELRRLFEPFFTTKPPGKGLGLGLPISREIVQRHGGEILVTSELDSGTTFTVVLPALDVPKPSGIRRPRVLFVDDEPAIVRTCRRAVEDGCDVAVAEGGLAALRLLEAEEFDVVVCDLWMPDMNGMDLYTRVESARPDLAAKFVFATGSLGNPTVQEFLKSVRGNRVLKKPFPMSDLRDIVFSPPVAGEAP